jgi:beta-glucosidase
VTAAEIVGQMTDDEKLWCLDGDAPCWAGLTYLGGGGYHRSPFYAARVERLGLPGFAFSDGPRGAVVDRATCFPVSMARGATWDLDLEERIGEAIGKEIRSIGATLYGGVCVNVLRHPAWGRAQETYGEDPHHVGEMGAALTRGVQRHAMATVKHFACNSMENARFRVDITVDEVALHEVYLPQFKRIVDEGVAVVMSGYNSVNGECCGDNRGLLTEILRDEWGFEGFVISDWIFGMRDAAQSVKAGLDVEMPYRMIRATHLREALSREEVSWKEVDRSVERIVSTLLRFDSVLSTPAPSPDAVLACAEHRAIAREAAAKSVVLLRNEPVDGQPVLPLDPTTLRRVAVVGERAAIVNLGDGGSSDVWAPEVVTILDGLRAALPDAAVDYDDGSDLTAAAHAVANADVALVVVGYTYVDEGEYIGDAGTEHLRALFPPGDDPELVERFHAEVAARRPVETPAHVQRRGSGFALGGDRSSLRLHDTHVGLIGAVTDANPRTVVAVVAGSAVVMSEWDTTVPAIVQSWYSGMEGGHGLADVLLGRVDASGRLPFSVPLREADLPPFDRDADSFTYDRWHGWWHLTRQGHEPAYPFGFGLSYTTFAVHDASATFADEAIAVTALVANTGARAGADVIQVYAHRDGSEGPPRLVGFARCELDAGADRTVALSIPMERLSERDTDSHAMVVRPGRYELRVARDASDPGIQLPVEVTVDITRSA